MTQKEELKELRRVGDKLQSESSRLAEFLRELEVDIPYEVFQALLGVESGVNQWTEIRKKSKFV